MQSVEDVFCVVVVGEAERVGVDGAFAAGGCGGGEGEWARGVGGGVAALEEEGDVSYESLMDGGVGSGGDVEGLRFARRSRSLLGLRNRRRCRRRRSIDWRLRRR